MKLLLTSTTLLIALLTQAAIIYVDVDSNALFPNGSSWSQAFDNMEDAWDESVYGDQIWVAEGNYSSPYRAITCGRNVNVYCGFQGWETQIWQRDWVNNQCVFTQEFNTYGAYELIVLASPIASSISIATIDGAYFSNWGYLSELDTFIEAPPFDSGELTLRNCSFTVVQADVEMVDLYLYSQHMDVIFDNCNFLSVEVGGPVTYQWQKTDFQFVDCSINACTFAGYDDEWVFENSTFVNTSITNCGMPAFAGSGCALNSCLVEGCLFYSEDQSAFHNADIINCTLVNNDCGKRLCAGVDVYNSIFYGNTSYLGFNQLSNAQSTAYNCMIQEEFTGPGANNSTDDPLFENPAIGDWCLSECSPAIDNTSIGISLYPLDLKGNLRVFNNELDQGCYEYQGASKAVIYVKDDATGNNDGSSWTNAFTHLQDAIDNQCDHSEIWVANGNYFPNPNPASVNRFATFSIPSGTIVYGGFDGDEFSLGQRDLHIFESSDRTNLLGTNGTGTNSDDAYRIMTVSAGAQDVVLDGLYFGYGRANGSGSFTKGSAIWMQNAEVDIKDCRFEANYSDGGGALFLLGSAEVNIYHSQFEFNSSDGVGGAILCQQSGGAEAQLTVDRSWFVYNSSAKGGAVYTEGGEFSFANSVFNLNSSDGSGNAIFCQDVLDLNNCTMHNHDNAVYLSGLLDCSNSIMWDNTSDFEFDPPYNPEIHQVNFCDLSLPIPGDGNINQDPLFVNEGNWDFQLQNGSPCINEGNDAFVEGDLDREGNNRIFEGDVDMGAFEVTVPCNVQNDLCDGATDIDVSTFNTVTVNMSCATEAGDIDVSSCGIDGARSVWYHFIMPNHRIQFYLGDEPDDVFSDRVLSVFRNSCANPIGSYCGQYLLIGPAYIEPGEDVFIKLTEWNSPDIISFNIDPIIPQILEVVATQQSDCFPGIPSATYSQQIAVAYTNVDTYNSIEVNGQSYELTGSPQYISVDDLIADGEFLDIEVSIPNSSASLTIPNIVQTPCCAPTHDDCWDPAPLSLDEFTIGKLDCASEGNDDILSSCTTNPGRSLWYEVPAPASGTFNVVCNIVELNGPFNVRLSVWDISDGCADALEVGCINQLGDNQSESGEVSGLNPGQYYLVMVSGYETQKGTFSLVVEEVEVNCGCDEDYDGNCFVNTADLLFLLAEYGCTSNCDADLTEDGIVNTADLLVLLAAFGLDC